MLSFLPLAIVGLVALALLLRRLVRLARFPGFGGRYDRELSFLNRGPRLAVVALVVLSVLPPAALGFYRVMHSAAASGATASTIEDDSAGAVPAGEDLAVRTPASENRFDSLSDNLSDGSIIDGSITHDSVIDDSIIDDPISHESLRDHATTSDRSVTDNLVPADLARYAVVASRHIGPEALASGEWTETVSPVDVLFVHAHPDDESIDFAVLMAALARNGTRIATLLLTDGESGLDRYPRRAAFPGYDDTRLAGEELREVRILEAQRALSILGSHYYLRPALPNHPYNGLADILELDEVIGAWGGREELTEMLHEVLTVLQPRLVVAPDGPSDAREHFEHEAAGYLMRRTVEQMRAEGSGPLGYLVSVDPFQREHYPQAVAVPGTINGTNLRRVQRAALSQHHTQADASVIAIRRLADIPVEYYLPVFWDVAESLGDMIGTSETIISPAHRD